MEALQAHILSLITAAVGIAVGFGVIDNTLAGEITAAGGVVLAAVVQVANVFHVKVGTSAVTAVQVAKINNAPATPTPAAQAPPQIAASALTDGEVAKLRGFAATLAGPVT